MKRHKSRAKKDRAQSHKRTLSTFSQNSQALAKRHRPTTAPSIDGLPEELIQIIIEELGRYDWNVRGYHRNTSTMELQMATLRNLCLVSRRYNRIAQPVLFRLFDSGIDLYKPEHGLECSRTSLFVRTLRERPDLGRHVRALRFLQSESKCTNVDADLYGDDNDDDHDDDDDDERPLPATITPFWLISQCMHVCLALGHSTKVEQVDLQISLSEVPQPIWRPKNGLTSALSILPKPLSELRTIKFGCISTERYLGFHDLKDLIRIPSLRRLEVSGLSSVDTIINRAFWPKGISDVEEVALSFVDMDPEDLRLFANAFKALKTIALDWDDAFNQQSYWDLADLMPVLRLHKDTLETVILEKPDICDSGYSTNQYTINDRIQVKVLPKEGNFKDFRNLKSLTLDVLHWMRQGGSPTPHDSGLDSDDEVENAPRVIPQDIEPGRVDLFPPSLEVLNFNQVPFDYSSKMIIFLPYLLEIGRRCPGSLPNLRSLGIWCAGSVSKHAHVGSVGHCEAEILSSFPPEVRLRYNESLEERWANSYPFPLLISP